MLGSGKGPPPIEGRRCAVILWQRGESIAAMGTLGIGDATKDTQRNIGTVGRFSINVTVAGLVTICTTAVVVACILLPHLRNEIAFVAAAVGAGAGIYSAYYLGAALHLRLRRDSLASTFELLKRLDDLQMTRVRVLIENNLVNKTLSPQEVYERIRTDPDIHSQVVLILGLFEDTSIAIQTGFVDEESVYLSLAWLIPFTYQSLRPYIIEERRLHQANILYCELERLANAWSAKKLLKSGKSTPPL